MKRWSHLLVLIPFLMIPTITPAQESVTPTPESVIGWAPCTDYKLATYEQIAEYFHVLDKATDRMQLVDIGETAEGRTQLMAIISSESNMQNLARYKEISQQLARARVLQPSILARVVADLDCQVRRRGRAVRRDRVVDPGRRRYEILARSDLADRLGGRVSSRSP